jgi:acetylornithine deacetylase
MTAPTLMQMLQALIGTPSISSVSPEWDQSNQKLIDQLAEWLTRLGFKVEVLPIPGYPGKANLVASIGSGPEGLVLSGHTDTVPCDEALWNSNPFQLSERDNRLYGLGTADMKSFFALVIEAVRELPLDRLKHPLTILATADEESSMCGAQHLVETNRQLGRHAIIGEPTGLKPIRTHKGIAMEAVRLIGRAGHSSDPALGVNALEGMHRVIGEILAWRSEMQARYRNPLFEVEVPTLNLGHIHGGDNPNRICGHCELHFDLRPLPGMHLDDLRSELEKRLKALLADSELKLETRRLFQGIEAMETPADARIVKTVEEMTGHPAGAVAFGTEGPYLNQLGMETIILGPGSIEQAHQPNEYIELSQINPTVELIRSLVKKFCL